METSQVQRAVEAARSTACELGLHVNDAVVIHNSDRIAVRLIPRDVLVRIAPQAWEDGLQFEADVARRLAETDSPVGGLEPRAEPHVYVRDTFALTLWTYYKQVGDIAPADYAGALIRIHADLRQIDLPAPHITERVAAWAEEVDNREQTPELPEPDREFLSTTFNRVRNAMSRWDTGDQLLHGEPHPGNLLSTSRGPLFIDFHTCQRGPVEYDIAYVPEEVAVHYPGADQQLLHQFRVLMWAGLTTMRWRPWDQLPNRDYWRVEGLNQLRAALARA
jgi:aminoglycoside phosphotransferase (APT) family kinase protein